MSKPIRRSRSKLLSTVFSTKILRFAVLLSCVSSLFVTFFLLDSTERQYEPQVKDSIRVPKESATIEEDYLFTDEVGNQAQKRLREEDNVSDLEEENSGGADDTEDVAEDKDSVDAEEDEDAEVASGLTLDPIILTIEPYHGRSLGGTLLTIKGHNLEGLSADDVTATVGGTPCLSTVLVNSEVVTCVTPAGAGAKQSVAVIKAGKGDSKLESTPNTLFTYDEPKVERVSPESGQTAGGTLLTVYGANFGTANVSIEVMLGSSSCEAVQRHSDGELTCRTPAQEAGTKNITVTVGEDMHQTRSVFQGLYTYALTPLEKLKLQSKDLLDGLSVVFSGTPIVFNQNARFEGKETSGKVMFTGRAVEYTLIPELLQVLPKKDFERKQHKTCAIVFNSRLLLEVEHGKSIDKCDAVFRYNNAPTRGFEKFVGEKTTYRFSQAEFLRSLLIRDPEIRRRVPKVGNDDILLATSEVSQDLYVALKKNFPYSKIYYVSNSLAANAKVLYKELQERFLKLGLGAGTTSEEGLEKESTNSSDALQARRLLSRSVSSEGYKRARGERGSEVLFQTVEPVLEVYDPPYEILTTLFAVQLCDSVDIYGLEDASGLGSGFLAKEGSSSESKAYFSAYEEGVVFEMGQSMRSKNQGFFDPGRNSKSDRGKRLEQIDAAILQLLVIENFVNFI